MEDRETPVLYLEMTEATPDAYAEERVGDVRALPGVERATWWRNVYRDRPDLPRVLPEFDTLGVYECTPTFVPPSTPEGDRRAPLRAYAAPGAGTSHRQADGVAVAGAHQPDAAARGAGAARLGRLRAPQPHRRGRRPGLHDDHALRERHRR